MFFCMLVPYLSLEAQTKPEPRGSSGQASFDYFTVRDSIEMARFERYGEPIFSPDGKYFAVVTSRGIIDRDEIESTLRIFKLEEVKRFLRNEDVTGHIVPRIVARMAAVPKVDYVNSYEPIISNVKWSDGSRSLLFLRQNSDKERQLCRADFGSGSFRALTPQGQDVSQFDVVGGTIVYRASRSSQSPEVGERINADARDISGAPLISVLFGKSAQRYPPYSELWVYRNGQNLCIRDPSTGRPVHLSNSPVVYPGLNPLSVSPDGRFVVALVPVNSIPKAWESYTPSRDSPKLDAKDPNGTADSNWTRPTEYTLVDLNGGRMFPLLGSPHGWALGYGGKNLAIWSTSGKRLLVTNTYLPLDNVNGSERLKRLRPCSAAVVILASNTSSCVTFESESSAALFGASFGETADEVVLRFGKDSADERYSYEKGVWQRISATRAQLPPQASNDAVAGMDASESLSVEIKEDLNTPAALWATDQRAGRSKMIWNPNPQLQKKTLGQTSVFHWKDKTGHEWTGGLVKPPDYVLDKRYPLVIQTHGFFASEFMSDGQYTTAFAARPLAAAGMVVLQVPDRSEHIGTGERCRPRHETGTVFV